MSRRDYAREYYRRNAHRRRAQKIESLRRLGKAHRYSRELQREAM
jgi:hypothetical protein